jgi:hypothetical protein
MSTGVAGLGELVTVRTAMNLTMDDVPSDAKTVKLV